MTDHEARARLVALETKVEMLLDRENKLLELLQAQHHSLDSLATIYREGIERARQIQQEAEAAIANPPWANGPLHMTEDEEDLQYLRDNNMLSQTELEDLLKEAGLEPTIDRL